MLHEALKEDYRVKLLAVGHRLCPDAVFVESATICSVGVPGLREWNRDNVHKYVLNQARTQKRGVLDGLALRLHQRAEFVADTHRIDSL